MRFLRKYRTIILGSVAMAMLIGSAVYSFDIEWRVIARLLFYCLLMLLSMITLAAAVVAGYAWLRKKLADRGG